MHALHEYLCKQIHDLLKKRRMVVFYDSRKDFSPFVDELKVLNDGEPVPLVEMQDAPVRLARFQGSFFGLRAEVEPLVGADQPEPLLLYVSGVARDRRGSVLMEIEKGGDTYEPRFKQIVRNVLRQKYTEGVIDGMLAPESITYADVVGFLEQNGKDEPYSMLRLIYSGVSDNLGILAIWLSDESKDGAIEEKQAAAELYALIMSRIGIQILPDSPVPQARSKVIRYLLINELRADLDGTPPASISMVPSCPSKDHLDRVRKVAEKLRKEYPEKYAALADKVESDLSLAQAALDPATLGKIDTFRFEESSLLRRCGELTASRSYSAAMQVIEERKSCFWVDRDISRQAQWESCRLMAELGVLVEAVKPAVVKAGDDPAGWIKAYAADDGWWRADLAYRSMESWVSRMDDEPEAEKALGVVRREYEELLRKMAEGFSEALLASNWLLPGSLLQTKVYSETVQPGGGRVAYFLVDAMRFEMGMELAGILQYAKDLALRPALAAFPTITPIGMAALLPGASSGFSVVVHGGRLASRVEGAALSNSTDRVKFFKSKVPDLAEVTLGKLLEMSAGKLSKTIGESTLVLVRSQEIDMLGEGGDDWMARQVMDTVVSNIARAIRKLAGCGIGRFVITSDHGFQFSLRKEEDMRMDNPGGDTVELHRRCWAGHGGTTPPGSIRVSGSELGYDTPLDFVFPAGLAVLKTSGGLRYHHGGISLQEVVVPVLSLRIAIKEEEKAARAKVRILSSPKAITNRTFGVEIACESHLFMKEPLGLRVILVSKGEQVGITGMALEVKFDRSKGIITLSPGEKASLGLMLNNDKCETLRIVVQDAATDAVLAQTEELPVKLGIR
jgi:hypothetical protein